MVISTASKARSSIPKPIVAAGGGSVPAQGGAKTPGAGGAERFLADLGGALGAPRKYGIWECRGDLTHNFLVILKKGLP